MRVILLFSFLFFTCISSSQELYFPPLTGNEWETTDPAELDWCEDRIQELYDFLDSRNTKAFILLKGGKIVLERYFDDFTQDSVWYWASAGKTVTAALTGIAQQEGFLDIHDPVSDYLGQGWTSAPPEKEELITVWHQLTMTSGLDDGVTDPYCTDPECLLYKADAGTRWAYHNGPYTNLSKVIESGTGMNYNNYYYSRLAQLTGMGGLWIYVGYNRLLFSTPRSMARFGLLMQNGGYWGDTPVLSDAAYFNEMIHPSQDINKSYGYLWWLNGQQSFMLPGTQFVFPGSLLPNAPDDMYAAVGKNGQYINISPGQDLLFVRMGESPDDSPVPTVFNNEIWQYINNLACMPNNTLETTDEYEWTIYPNPVIHTLRIMPPGTTWREPVISVFNILGREVRRSEDQFDFDVSDLPAGVYECVIVSGSKRWVRRFMKL